MASRDTSKSMGKISDIYLNRLYIKFFEELKDAALFEEKK